MSAGPSRTYATFSKPTGSAREMTMLPDLGLWAWCLAFRLLEGV